MAAAVAWRKNLQTRSLFKTLMQNRGLPFAANLIPGGRSKLLFYRCLCHASRNLYPEDQGRKIMVAGLKEGRHETGKESLEQYFKSYGPVERAKIVRDQFTGRSKGYGFVTFMYSKAVERAMSAASHFIDGKGVRISLAVRPVAKSGYFPGRKDVYSEDVEERKIFVSSLKTGAEGTTEKDLKLYFSGFGEVEEVRIVPRKSYGFVTFRYAGFAKEVLSKPSHSIAGWIVNVERPFSGKDKGEIAKKGKRTVNVYFVSSDISNDELITHFSSFGKVEKILGRDSGSESNSQCMVVFKEESSAKLALGQQLQKLADGGKLYVKPMTASKTSKTILLRGTPANVTLETLQLYFEQFGEIVRMDLTNDHLRPTHNEIYGILYRIRPGLPTIEFADEGTAEKVLQRDHVIFGAEVEVRKVDARALNSGPHSQESDRSMMVLIEHLPRHMSKKTVVDYFAGQSLDVQSVECKMEGGETMSCVVGFWNLDDVDQVINKASAKNGVLMIDGKMALVRRLHWESSQEELELDSKVEGKFQGSE